jgi:hypothetical protein
MSKKINTDDIANDLAGSLFFGKNARPVGSDSDETLDAAAPPAAAPSRRGARAVASFPASTSASASDSSSDSSIASTPDSTPASQPDSQQARRQASAPDRTTASTQADSLASTLASSSDLADAIYRVVKKPGKQTSYVRVTEREKSALAAILAGIGEDHGYKVTETELIRIAICSALADYAENGIDSLLMRVIIALRD